MAGDNHLVELARDVVRRSLEAGATDAECTISEGDEFSANIRMREVMLPILQFPVAVPVFIAGVEASTGALKGDPVSDYAGWIKLAAGFSIIFVVLSYLLFEYVLEE